jgi:hypothetical protein
MTPKEVFDNWSAYLRPVDRPDFLEALQSIALSESGALPPGVASMIANQQEPDADLRRAAAIAADRSGDKHDEADRLVSITVGGSTHVRTAGEWLALARASLSHAAPVGEDAIQQVMWAVFSYADRREAFTDAPVGEPRHIARQSLQAQEDYIRGLLTKMMPSAKE